MDGKTSYHQRIREIILNPAKEYCENNKDRIREQARNIGWGLSNEEKAIKREYKRHRYQNMSEGNKQRLKEYQKNYYEAKKLLWCKNKF